MIVRQAPSTPSSSTGNTEVFGVAPAIMEKTMESGGNLTGMKRIFSFFLLAAFGACAPPESSQQKLIRELDMYFNQHFPPGEPGGAVLIARGDSIVFSKGYGLADLATKEPVTTKTLFNLGSISKTFVSNAILMLQEEHKLSVEDSIYKYFPNFKNKALAKRIKIKHLLSHTSGLPDNRQVGKDTVFYLTARDAENWYPVTQTDTLVFEPGQKYEYSNPAFNGLALIVEQVSGMKWQGFIEDRIFKPSGMETSTITDGPHPQSGVSHGYVKIDGQWREDDYGEEPTFAAAGNGGVWSSVEELNKYERALKKSLWLKPETIAESRTVFSPSNWSDTIPPRIGWSWFVGETADHLKTVGHTGSQGGFLCNYVTVPDKEIQFIILCNTPREVSAFTKKVMDALQTENWLNNL
jgi:CubicO group peptidase (beta-lactamase class C family)